MQVNDEQQIEFLKRDCPLVTVALQKGDAASNAWGYLIIGHWEGDKVIRVKSGSIKTGCERFRDAYARAVEKGIVK